MSSQRKSGSKLATESINRQFDVVIAGYGPTGATLGKLLARGGLRVLLVEREPDIFDKPRAIGIDHEAMRTFQFCEIAHELFTHVRTYEGSEWHGVTGEVVRAFAPAKPPYALGWPPNVTFLQPQLEGLLRASVAKSKLVTVLTETDVIGFDQSEHEVHTTIQNRKDGRTEVVRSNYLVGCDGANSVVRRGLGIELDDLGLEEWWVVIDALRTGEADYGNRNVQYCNPERPATYVVGPGALRRWEFRILPHETPEEFRDSNRAYALLSEKVDTSDLKLWRHAVYCFRARVATRWHEGRVFLAGDAAHQTPPHLGQGMVSGIRDATNLAWKLLHIHAGGSPQLLESYITERRPHFRSLVQTAKDFGDVIGILDREKALARDVELKRKFAERTVPETRQNHIPPLIDGFLYRDATGALGLAAGELFIQPEVMTAQGTRWLDDGAEQRFQIIAVDGDSACWLDSDHAALWAALQGERLLIGDAAVGNVALASATPPVRCLSEVDGRFAHWMSARSVRAVVVRPDRYVYGVAANAEALHAIVREISAHVFGPNAHKAEGLRFKSASAAPAAIA